MTNRLYTCAVLCYRDARIFLAPLPTMAESEDDAKENAMEVALGAYPVDDGYHGHLVVAGPVSDAMLYEAAQAAYERSVAERSVS